MKKYVVLSVFFAFLSACSSPLLDWIETDAGSGRVVMPASSDKAITAFSFGVPGEEISIRAEPGQDGTISIKAILPPNTSLERLGPSISYIGKSITPPGGTVQTAFPYADSPRNFTVPQVYTVTAGDGGTQSYTVQAYVKDAASAAIVWFDLEIPGGGNVMSEGVITEGSGGQPGEIILHVPSGTNLTSLTAKVAQTGTLSGPGVSGDSRSAVTLTGDFSPSRPRTERTYTVTAGNGTVKEYTVTVITDRSGVKEITAFFFTESVNNETVIIGGEPQPDGKYPIVVTVPVNVAYLTPTIVYKGADIDGAGISDSHGANFDNPLPASADSPQDFTTPVTYRITAEDGSVRDYEVTVYRSDLNTGKQITGFYFSFPNAQGTQGSAGIINETAKTIAITVPAGTNLTSLAPAIYHTGVSISPIDGEPIDFSDSIANPVPYTVTARDRTTQTYRVSVFVAKRSDKAITAFDFANAGGETTVIGSVPDAGGKIPIVVTVPSNTDVTSLTPVVTHTGASITGGGIPAGGPGTVTGSGENFTAPVTYTVTAEDGSIQVYSVTVVKTADPTLDTTSALASIDGFYVNNPMAVGSINQGAKTIAVTVPNATDVTNLIPTIYFTGSKIMKESDTTTEQTTHPATIAADFSASVQYTVTALDGTTTATYTVTVTVDAAPLPPSSVRAITFVGFAEINDVDLTSIVSTVPDTLGVYPVEVLVPAGTTTSNLTPVILYKDRAASISGPGSFSPPDPHPTDPEIEGIQSSASVNFSSPQTYTVISEDGASSDYVVTVREEDNNVKEITSFYFTSPVAVGVIDQDAKIIDVTVPNGTNLTGLSPTVSYTGVSLSPASGNAVDFSSPVSYTVTARNGTAQPYTVRVIPLPSSAREITAVSLPGISVVDTIIGAIPDSDGHIPISVTVSEQTNISALRPTITHTGVSITPPDGTAQSANPFTDTSRDFEGPKTYRVTAEDGGFKDYAISVHVSGGGARVITGFMFKTVRLGVGTVSVVGQINQNTHTIEVKVPHSADISGLLAPTITYLGKSVWYTDASGGIPSSADTNTAPSGKTGNTYTDTARNFSADRFYTVKAADGSTQEYTVTVTQIPEVTISYEGLWDDKFITDSFDQRTGLLSITIITTTSFPASNPSYSYTDPYDWYVDGIDQPLADTQNTLVIKTTDFEPGRHQITASAKRSSDGKHYTNILYFAVRE